MGKELHYNIFMTTAAIFKHLVPIANPSGQEDAIRQAIIEQLSTLGWKDYIVDQAGNLLVRIPGDVSKPTFLLSAHMDSVPPCIGIEPVEDMRDGRAVIRSAGKTVLGADDKSGIAVMLEIARRLKESGNDANHPVELMFSTQEEVGLLGAKAFDMSLIKATAGFVLDGEGHFGEIFTGGPTQKNLVFTCTGKASHAGIAPENGVNAISMAARLCAELSSGRISPYTTTNMGTIEGGHAMNIVPAHAMIRAEARSHKPEELEKLLSEMTQVCEATQQAFPGGTVDFVINHRYDQYIVPADHTAITVAEAACKKLGVNPQCKLMNIGSDAHILNHGGLPTVVLGMGFHYSHSLGEYIDVAELEQVSEWVWEILHA